MTLKQKKAIYKKCLGIDRLFVSLLHVHCREVKNIINRLKKDIEKEEDIRR